MSILRKGVSFCRCTAAQLQLLLDSGTIRKTQHPVEVVGALYNYKFVKEDGSKGIHNTTYAVQLLMDSIKSLDKSFDDSKRPQ